jgi:hypothetical protein
MCRSIKQLRRPDIPVSDQELHEAALQYVRKISGYRKPSRANNAAFEAAVLEIASSTRRLLDNLESHSGQPTNRQAG